MVESSAKSRTIAGIILAGGQARRLGGDKPLRPLGAKPLLAHAISRAAPQVATLALSVNGDPAPFGPFDLPIVADSVPGFAGPLAGILAGMDWAAGQGCDALASFACDAPFFPLDLVGCLREALRLEGAEIAIAASQGRPHPVFALWPVSLRGDLRRAVANEGLRKVDAWAARYRSVTVSFAALPFDPFFNVNTPEDLAKAETLLATPASADNRARGALQP
jgi:molybdopterin-guanine dinucleotide biosynthesis protein A